MRGIPLLLFRTLRVERGWETDSHLELWTNATGLRERRSGTLQEIRAAALEVP